MWRPVFRIALWLASLALFAVRAAAASDDGQFLDGLRARELFELAEKYSTDRLADPRISGSDRADLTIELSRTLAQHALAATGSEAPRLWQQSVRVVEELATRHPRDPKVILVRLQGALAMTARGEAARELNEGSGDAESSAAARGVLRDAIAEMRSLAGEIAGQLERRGRARAGTDELSTAQLQSLEMSVRYELARALRNQGLSYPPGTADRIYSLSQAIESLTALSVPEPRTLLDWSAALEEIACLRLLGEYTRAERKLVALEENRPQPEFGQQLRAERIRVALAREQIDEALSEAGASGAQQPTGSEAELARLEAMLAAWRRASERQNAAEAADWQRRAVEQVRAIGQSYGPRWMRKAQTLLARTMADSTGPQSAELLAQAAEGYYRGGQFDQALAAYDRARARADEQQQSARSFELGLAAATIEKDRKHYRDALERYRALAAIPAEPKAAEAHLLAVYCAAQLAQSSQPPKLDEYERLLREHVDAWPAGPTASQAWTWLGRLAVHRGVWQDAVAALAHVKPADPQMADAVATMDRAYEGWFEELHQNGESGERIADEALAWFERVTAVRGGKPNAASRSATLAAARIWLKEIPTGALPAERLLRAALDDDPDAPEEWMAAARTLLVPALAAQGKGEQAAAALDQIPRGRTADSLALFQTLSAIRRRASQDVRRSLAEIELTVADNLLEGRNELDAATMRAVKRERAAALAAVGRQNEALSELQVLARAFPRDGQTQEELAALLSAGGEADLDAAVVKWTEVAGRSRAGTPRWLRAHYGLARAQLATGQVVSARATIARVASKYPDFGGVAMKRKFDDLATEIDARPDRALRTK